VFSAAGGCSFWVRPGWLSSIKDASPEMSTAAADDDAKRAAQRIEIRRLTSSNGGGGEEELRRWSLVSHLAASTCQITAMTPARRGRLL